MAWNSRNIQVDLNYIEAHKANDSVANTGKEKFELTIGDDEFGGLAQLLDLALLVHAVRLLVVHEQVSGASSGHPLLENLLVGLLVEGLLHIRNSN